MKLPVFYILLVLCLMYSCSYAGEWLDGYIVSNTNDTIYGQVQMKNFERFQTVWFRSSDRDSSVKYLAEDLKSFVYGQELYRAFNISNEFKEINYSFAKLQREDRLSLYYTEFREVTCSCNPAGEIVKGHILLLKGKQPVIVEKRLLTDGFVDRNSLADYLSDNKELSDQILNKELGYLQLNEIVDRYNSWATTRLDTNE